VLDLVQLTFLSLVVGLSVTVIANLGTTIYLHSPVLLGWKKVQFMNVALYRRTAKDASTVARYAKDIPQTRIDRLLWVIRILSFVRLAKIRIRRTSAV
jgi:hypothetical protein